jgi:hypothetical protein
MKKKRSDAPALPEDWTLPAFADRRRAPRPARLTARQKALALAKRKSR